MNKRTFWGTTTALSAALLFVFGRTALHDRYSRPVDSGILAYENLEHRVFEDMRDKSETANVPKGELHELFKYVEKLHVESDIRGFNGAGLAIFALGLSLVGLWQNRRAT